jgi:hypothetical protein
MRMTAARRKRNLGAAQLALLLVAGCSLQDFDYLQQQGTGGSNAGGTSSSAGTSTAGTETGEGGEAAGPSAGGKGGSAPTGGSNASGSASGGSASGNGGSSSGTGGGGKGGDGGTGATGELVNGSFETNTTIGWTLSPATSFAFTQQKQGTATIPDGIYQFSTWAEKDAFTVDLHQTIEGVEDGTYVFKGYFNLGGSFNSVEAYATDCGGDDPEPIAILPAGASAWLPIEVSGIEVKGGSCTVGVRIDSNAQDWLNADLFTFERLPDVGAGGAGGDGGQGGAQ